MNFNDYDNTCRTSLMGNKCSLEGNSDKIKCVQDFIRTNCIEKMDLYEAADETKKFCIETYGEAFWIKSSEAITFLVEDAYCDVERNNHPLFDHDFEQDYLY